MNVSITRVESEGCIRWFRNGDVILESSSKAYYLNSHYHPLECPCDALIHNDEFQKQLKEAIGH